MSVVDQNGSYFNQAKQTIKKLLGNLEEGDEAGLILSSGNSDTEISMTTNISLINEHLKDIKISSGSKTINSVLIKASGIISKSENFNREIYLLTDFQKSRLAIEENITNLSQILNERVKLYSFDYSDREVYNIGIDKLEVKTKIFEKYKPLILEATVTNYSEQTVKNLVVSLFVGGKRSTQKSVDLAPQDSRIVFLEGLAERVGYTDLVVEIENDEIIEDNRRFTSIFIPDKLSVLLLYENLKDLRFIQLALLSGKTDENLELIAKPLSKIKSLKLNSYNVIIIVSNNINTGSDDLRNYLSNGGGLIVFPSSDPDLPEFENTLKSLTLPPPRDIIIDLDETNRSINFEKIDNEHPLLQNIFRDDQKKEFESPVIQNYYKIFSMGKGRNIITLIDGSSFLSEYNIENGKVCVFNVSPVLEWSDFPIKSIFAPLIYKSVFYLSTKDRSESEYAAGESLNINIVAKTIPLIKIVRPDQSEDLINFNGIDNEFLSYSKTFISGNYKIFSGDNLLETISVNTNPLESNLDFISDEQFDEYLDKVNFKGSHIRISKGEDPVTLILQARFGSELWRYFLLAAFVLALLEMTIARSARKELVEINK
jgi:hypothetical protein